MSEKVPRRWPDVIMSWLLLGGVAIGIGSLAVSPPHAFRKGWGNCQMSGTVTCRGRLVTRGTVFLSCMMLPDPGDVETYPHDEIFPDLTVPIIDGRYAITSEDGLLPGSYEVTVHADQLDANPKASEGENSRRAHVPRYSLVPVATRSHRVLDIEVEG